MSKKQVILYTDGACSGNPGPGGWGCVLIYNSFRREASGGELNTTNNRMEITAIIEGLKLLNQPCVVDIFTDSAYVVNSFEQNWITNWQKHNWKTSTGKQVENIDLWKSLLVAMKPHEVRFHKVKGHADNELNNRCDKLATAESSRLKS